MYGLTQLMRILNEVKNQRLRLVEFPLGKSARQKTKTTIAVEIPAHDFVL